MFRQSFETTFQFDHRLLSVILSYQFISVLSNFLRQTKFEYVFKYEFVEPNYTRNNSFHLRFFFLIFIRFEDFPSVLRKTTSTVNWFFNHTSLRFVNNYIILILIASHKCLRLNHEHECFFKRQKYWKSYGTPFVFCNHLC